MFEIFDYKNEDKVGDKYAKEEWYGKKEVPNILLTIYKNEKNYSTVYFDILKQYYESYDNINGWKVIMELSLMSINAYEAMTEIGVQRYTTQADNFWRKEKTGKDVNFIEHILYFNKLKIEHKLTAEGNPTNWYITLWNEKPEITKYECPTLKEVKL